ncbi:hypothetical protein RvY_05683 [Ramazzottius varieornatus]|uniref:Uncharacterized protein n=1 Tax=Ramazzottius varieornatus TaxID=947166 RepID=A0A1D1UVW0_RAMVA|nr:hypothetical protein RvY_05683 [Ramazzottius varieornatus]
MASRTGGSTSATASRIQFSPQSTTLPASSSGSTVEASRESSSASASTSLPRQDAKPLKGILMHQGLRSQDATPSSSPRTVPDSVHFQTPVSEPANSVRKPDTQRGKTSNAVADFLRKFSPKLNRSKKTLHWYTVDIQPTTESSVNSHKGNTASDLDSDTTIKNLQNGRISSEFSSEMSECLARRLDEKPRAVPPALPTVPPPSSARGVNSRTAQDRVDFLMKGTSPRSVTMMAPSIYGSPVSKSMPTTPVAHMQQRDQPSSGSEWRMLMVDINVDKKDTSSQSYGSASAVANGLDTRRTYFQDSNPHLDRRDDGHVPSYIRLSRALNGYSARNMYSSKKLVNSRDYNVLLCRSEEFLNRPVSRSTTPAIRTDLIRSGEKPSGLQSAREFCNAKSPRRAASEGRDLTSAFAEAETVPLPAPTVKTEEEKPGYEFLRRLEHETTALRDLVKVAQAELDTSADLTENEKEHLLSAVGKTNLLLSQKCRQFEDLCRKNIDEEPDEKIKTTFSDLEGFWDLINIQITNCRRMFDDRARLQSSNEPSNEPSNASGLRESTTVSGAEPDASGHGVLKQGGSRRSSQDISSPAGRRSSKPKVTFQLTERDVQRKEMIAAKRREFEQQQQQGKTSVDVIDTPSVAGPGHEDVQIYVAPNGSSE